MMCNLLTSQLIAPMSAQYRSTFIYVTIGIGFIVAVYTIFSTNFKNETVTQIKGIQNFQIQN